MEENKEYTRQENNNFETIISNWRRMSVEPAESVAVSMSGDSPNYYKKNEESALLVPEKVKSPIASVEGVTAKAASSEAPDQSISELEEKLLNPEKEENKDAAGDSNVKDRSLSKDDYIENNDISKPDSKQDKAVDKVDSVFINSSSIKPPPPQSSTSNPDEDDCIIKCLYYTLQCCDCVLM